MNNNIQCSIESSTTKIELNSAVDGVFLVPELEGLVGLPEIRTTSGVNAGYDGGWTSAQNYDARLISIRGVIANPDISKVEDKRRAIASLLGQGRKEQLTLRFTTEAGNAYAISVRTISCEMALQRVLTTQEFLIQLRADDPLIYDDGTTGGIAAILQPQRALGGFEINFELPLAIGGGAEDTVVDNGNETVYPVIKLYGALHSPTVVNRTTNQQMQILADLQYSIDWHTYRSATGDYILVSDGLNGAPMTLSQLTGNAEQTTYSGKNLLDALGSTYITEVGATATKSGNSVTFTKTQDGPYRYAILRLTTAQTNALLNKTLTMSFDKTTSISGVQSGVRVYWMAESSVQVGPVIDSTDGLSNTSGSKSFTFNIPAAVPDNTKPCIGFFFYPDITNTAYSSSSTMTMTNIQLEASSTATAYEPYVGGIPAPNPDYPQAIEVVTGEQTVKITGKNLVEDTISGSSIDANGIIRSNPDFDTQVAFVIEGETYTLSYTGGTVVGGYFATKPTINSVSIDGTRIVNNNKTFVAQYTGYFTFRTNAGESNAQCELGNQATSYTPYQGQNYEVNLGKNLFGGLTFDHAEHCTYTLNGLTLTITPQDTTNNTAVYFKLGTPIEAGTYTLNSQTSLSSSTQLRTASNTVAYNFGNGYSNKTFTTTATATAIAFNWLSTSSTTPFAVDLSTLQIERGSRATSYASYITPIELCKVGNYQDRIYKDDGKWYIEKQVGKAIFDGSENITVYNTKNSILGFRLPVSQQALMATMPLCDYFQAVRMVVFASDDRTYGTIAVHNSQTVAILYASAPNSSITTADGFKTWLASNPTTVYYALATPTITEITDETLRAQLNFLASLYEGENNISLVGTGAQGEMAISYATDYTVNQDVITIDSQARTITLNGQDVYHLKTSESEFLVLAPGENKLYLTSEVSDDSGYAEVKFKQGYLSI